MLSKLCGEGNIIYLRKLEYDFTICKVKSEKELDLNNTFYFVGKTDEEISLVCKTENIPLHTIEREDGWKGFRIQGVLDVSVIGVLSQLTTILAQNKIGVFVISSFNTDYIFVKKESFEKASRVIRQEGYFIIEF